MYCAHSRLICWLVVVISMQSFFDRLRRMLVDVALFGVGRFADDVQVLFTPGQPMGGAEMVHARVTIHVVMQL